MTLPTLALRGVSVFPGTVLHFDVERPMSIAALNAAIGTDRMIFLVAQRDIACDTPRADDLYTVGTICRLSQILRAPGGGNVKCIVDGLYRAKLLRLTAETPALWANVRVLADKPVDADTLECTALIRSCNDLFAEYASASGTIGPETLLRVADRKEPGFVSDYIAQNVFLQPAEKQLLLEECSPLQRLTMLCDMLHRELEIMDIQQNLQSTAAERVAKNQKDYFLREQMRVIQEELGEASETDDLDEYRRKILDLGLDAEIEKKLLKELSRLAKQPFGSAEGAVLRTYLDICLELPWNERTKDVTDIAHAKKVLDEDHYGLTKVKDRILEYLAVRQLSAQVKGGVLCLVGPPGVGKTSIAMSIARATNRKCARISLGGVHDEAEIRGHRKTYVGATPGKTVQVNYFLVDGTYFIDLPGYGYARVSGDERRRWGALMEDFFQEPNLFTMGVLIVDSRHAPTADDVTMAEYFFDAGRPFVVVANKCDKLKKSEIGPNLERIRDVLGLDDDFPLLLYSCTAKVGRRELLGFIENNI